MLISANKLLKKIKIGRALCAFNFSTPEVAEAIVAIASRLKTPVILATSQGEASFLNPEIAQAIANFLSEKYKLSLALNLDHAQEMGLIKRALAAGYSAIHIDGSRLPFEENVRLAQTVVSLCQPKGVSVEGEIGIIPGQSSLGQQAFPGSLTNPKQALEFVEQTKVDFLAVSIGESHGLKKPDLDFELLNQIVRLIKVPLVLHGGSGIAADDLKKSIALGVRKVNFNTELRLAWAKSLRQTLAAQPEEIVPYKILPAIQQAVARVVEEKIKICNL